MRTFAAIYKSGTVTTLIQLHPSHKVWYVTATYQENTIQRTVHTKTEVWLNATAEMYMESVKESPAYSYTFIED